MYVLYTNFVVLNTDCFPVFDNNLRSSSIQNDLKVSSGTNWLEESGRAALSNSVLAHRLSGREPDDLITVNVFRDRVSSLDRGCEDVFRNVGPPRKPLDVEQSVGCMVFPSNSIDLRVILRAHEIRQNLSQSERKVCRAKFPAGY